MGVIRKPIDPDGHTVQDISKIETLSLNAKNPRTSDAEIELAQHDDGLWMWSTKCRTGVTYRGYRVGPKWGQFATTKQAAIEAACNEIRSYKPADDVLEWLDQLCEPQQTSLF